MDVYNYVTEHDINESCIESLIHYLETLHPLPWEHIIAFAPGKFVVDVSSLEGITVVPPPTGRIHLRQLKWHPHLPERV